MAPQARKGKPVPRRSGLFLALGVLLSTFAGCLGGQSHGDRQDDFARLLKGKGTIKTSPNFISLNGNWQIENADFGDPFLSIHLVGGNLTITHSNLKLANLRLGEFRSSGHLRMESSTLVGGITVSDGTAVVQDSLLTPERPGFGGVFVSAYRDEAGLVFKNSTISTLASFRGRFIDPPVGRMEGLLGSVHVSTKTPVDLSGLQVDVAGLELLFEMTSSLEDPARPLPQKFPLGRLNGTVDRFDLTLNKGQALVVDTDGYALKTHKGETTPIEAEAWTEFTGHTRLPYNLCGQCSDNEFMPHALFGPPEAVACQPPKHDASGHLRHLVGHGHWLTVGWELPAPQVAGDFVLRLTAKLPNGQEFVALDGNMVWNYISEFQVPLLSALCLDDGGTPTQAVSYEVKLFVGEGGAGAGGCARIEPDATAVNIVPHFYGRREDKTAFMGLPCPASQLPV